MKVTPFLSVFLLSAAAASAGPVYHVTYLGNLGSFGPLLALGLNNNNQVVGGGLAGGSPFFWSNGVMTDLAAGSPYGLGVQRVNDSGQAVGFVQGISIFRQAAIHSIGSMEVVPLFPGSGGANGLGINSSGHIVGETALPGQPLHAFLYAGGVLTDLGAFGGDTRAVAINDSGIIAMTSNNAGVTRSFVRAGGITTEITLGGASATVYDINAAGQIVGTGQTASGEWRGFVYGNNTITDLGSFSPLGINDLGDMVGSTPAGPAVLLGGTIYQLNSILDSAGTPFPITYVSDINNQRAIVGNGAEQRVYDRPLLFTLVSDVPEPGTLGMVAASFGVIALLRRRLNRP